MLYRPGLVERFTGKVLYFIPPALPLKALARKEK
jgi:hypothetical protein